MSMNIPHVTPVEFLLDREGGFVFDRFVVGGTSGKHVSVSTLCSNTFPLIFVCLYLTVQHPHIAETPLSTVMDYQQRTVTFN